MNKVYLDNAATTCRKPREVIEAITSFMTEIGCSPGRGGYECSLSAGRLVLETRLALAKLFQVPSPQQIVFTHNITYALNYAIKGLLKQGDHVITTSMEHNAVVRPLKGLEKRGIIEVDFVRCDKQGRLDPADVERYVRPNTRMLVCTHASNVTGTLMPVDELGRIARKHDLLYVIDTAQTAGVYALDFTELGCDVLAFTGHKGLMGPPGTGGFAVSQRAAREMVPLIEGGTGSISDREYQPDFLPDKFESGTMNTPGLAGLKAAVEYIQQVGLSTIREHEQQLTQRFLKGLAEMPEVTVYGPADTRLQVATVSITVADVDMGELSFNLDDRYGIMTRSGLHCAPLAHRTIGTFPEGTLRFSFGYFNTLDEIDYALNCLKKEIQR